MEKHAVPVQHCLVTITGVLNYVLQEDEKASTWWSLQVLHGQPVGTTDTLSFVDILQTV